MPTPPPSIYETVIKRIRDKCPFFAQRVGGTSQLSEAYKTVATSDIALPQCWVVPLYEGDESQEILDDEESENPQHKIAEYFSTIVVVDNADQQAIGGKGNKSLTALASIEQARRELRTHLMGWRILPRFSPTRFSRGDHLAMNAKYLWHVWEWRYSEIFTPGQVDAEIDVLSAAANDMDDMPSFANSVLPRLRTIHIGFQNVKPGRSNAKDTLLDYFDSRPVPTAPTEEMIQAAIDGREDFIEVNVAENVPPLPLPSPEEIGDKVFHVEHFDDYFLHGSETVEPPDADS